MKMSNAEPSGQERRITYCLYDCWNKITELNGIPPLKNMKRSDLDPFKKNLALIDLRNGHDQATFQVIGQNLARDLDEDLANKLVSQVPRGSILSRITDHYLEALANRVPIAFEAEFINSNDEEVLYRGILLPFSDDGENINFILAGLRWILAKDLDQNNQQPSIEELMKSISNGRDEQKENDDPLSPIETEKESQNLEEPIETSSLEIKEKKTEKIPQLNLGHLRDLLKEVAQYIKKEDANHNSSRDSLYNILTAINKFHNACKRSPDEFNEILKEHKLKTQRRAPFTPVLKICLGKNYDKTRLTEYAAALGIANYMDVSVDDFQPFIKSFPGGIKGCVKEMRAIKKDGEKKSPLQKGWTAEEAREIVRNITPIANFKLKKMIVSKKMDEFCLLLAKRNGHTVEVLKILEDKYTKLDPIIRRTAFIRGNLKAKK